VKRNIYQRHCSFFDSWFCSFSKRQHRSRPSSVGGDASDAGARDCEGEESEGGALGGEARAEAEDWVSAGLIKAEWLLRGAGRVGASRGAGAGCEGVCQRPLQVAEQATRTKERKIAR